MAQDTPPLPDEARDDLTNEIRSLRKSVERLNGHTWVRIENSLPRTLFRQVLKGLALGFGTVVGASVLVSVAVYFLTKIDFVPIVGEWANEIADVIQAEVESRRAPGSSPAEANQDGSITPENAPEEDAPESAQ